MSIVSRSVAAPSRPALPRLAAALAVALCGLVLMVWGAPHATAHNSLISSDPVDGSTVATAPEQITLVFNEAAQALGSEIVVTDPNGVTVSEGAPQLADATVSQPLAGDLPAGVYTVTWRVTSADGHPIDGSLTFTAQAATAVGVDPGAEASPEVTTQATQVPEPISEATVDVTPAPDAMAQDEDAGLAAGVILAIVVGALAVVAAVVVIVIERRKSKAAQDK
ncbi:copper resistance CopC family protein [Cellulomonas sp. NPDC089187]|uniref:copper resistance CopC family protein n=1 Tax=Cellulomonas sp. NPDC089187 TaxID=3154970 RepID=UPI00344A7A9E